ncbi:TIM barrel protein [Deferribacter thermophilus]|uniref:TIM barrel protein n=1 Tax=Deferribacter thermophilus TaxID=53573 RepID=UPI003C1A92CF
MILARIPYKRINDFIDYIISENIYIELTFEYDDDFNINKLCGIAEQIKTVHLPFFDINLGSKNRTIAQKSLDILEKFCYQINDLNISNAVLHHNYSPYHYAFMEDEFVKRFVEMLSILIEKTKPNYRICLENVFEDTPSVIYKILISMNSTKIGVCFDFGHFNLFSKVDLEFWLSLLKDKIYEYHVHNNFGIRDEHNSLDKGTFDYKKAFDILIPEIIVVENNNIDDFKTSVKIIEKVIGGIK